MTLKTLLAAGACAAALLIGTAHAAEDRAAMLKAHSGGTLKLTASAGGGTMDPQVNYEVKGWELFASVYDGLVTFQKVGGSSSNVVVPDIAEAIPTPQDGGKTYVFKIRQGIHFSNGQELGPKDVVASFQRLFKVNNPNAGSWYNSIVGGDACLKDAAASAGCTLAGGVIADEAAHTVTFHLTAPSSEFLYQLSVPFGSILPADTAGKDLGTTPPPGTGSYMIASYDPNTAMKLVRNPHFKEWSAAAQPQGYADEIQYAFGLKDEDEVTAVLNGQQDWMYDEKPLDRLGELGSKHKDITHIANLLAYYYMPMNVRMAPFDNIKARQALAYAVDRGALVKLYGGPNLASPLCQQLPVGMGGYEPYCPFTKGGTDKTTKWTAPDLEKAKQLVKESGTAGQKVTLISSDKVVEKSMGEYLVNMLRNLGYDAQLKAISSNDQFNYIQNSKNKVQISLTDWFQDYPAPSDFLNVLFSSDSFHEGSDNSINIAGYSNLKIDADMKAALALAVTDPKAANVQWAKIDKAITDEAPAVSLLQPKNVDIVSKRVGNYSYSDQYHMLFSPMWVK